MEFTKGPRSFIVDRAGNIVIVGTFIIDGSGSRGFIMKINSSNGDLLYNRNTDQGFNGCRLHRIIQMNASGTNSSDDYVVLGQIGGVYTEKHFVARIKGTTLVGVWAFNYDINYGTMAYSELVYSLVQAGGGDIVLGGQQELTLRVTSTLL